MRFLPAALQAIQDHPKMTLFRLMGVISIYLWMVEASAYLSPWLVFFLSLFRYIFLLYIILVSLIGLFYPQYKESMNPGGQPALANVLQSGGFVLMKGLSPTVKIITLVSAVSAVTHEPIQGRFKKAYNTETPILTHMVWIKL